MSWLEYNQETGVIHEIEGDSPRGGRWRLIKGEFVRIGEGRAPADRPFSASQTFNAGSGVKSPVDGKMYYDVNSYEQSVKRAGCSIMGNDTPTTQAKKDVQGDFDVRQELTKATRQVLAKQ